MLNDAQRELLEYNALDVLGTARLKPLLDNCLTKYKATSTYEIDLKMSDIAIRMHHWGIPVDLEVNRTFAEYLEPLVEEARKTLADKIVDPEFKKRFLEVWATEAAKKKRKADSDDFITRREERKEQLSKKLTKAADEINLDSPPQVVALLKACGVPLNGVTKKGATSTKKDFLEALAMNPTVRALLQYREKQKILGGFVLPIIAELDKDLRTHPVWGVNMISGRWNSKRNWQNHTKGEQFWPCECGHPPEEHTDTGTCRTRHCGCTKLKLVKKSFENWVNLPDAMKGMPNLRWQVRPRPGRTLVGGDMAQLEARVIALLSGDPYLIKAFMDGVDIHSEFAKEVFVEFATLQPKSPRWVKLRDLTKRAEYGYLYGGSDMTIWTALVKEGEEVPFATIQKMVKIFDARMPYVHRYYTRLIADVMTKKEMRSFLLERRQMFPLGNAEEPTVKNFVCQAGGADVVNTGLWRLWTTIQGDRVLRDDVQILIQGHDAITMECAEKNAEKLKRVLEESMTQEFEFRGVKMRFPVEADIGPSWAET